MELVIHLSGVNCLAVRRLSVDAWVVETGQDDTEVVVTRLVTEAVVQWWEGGSCCAAHWGLCVRAVGGHHRGGPQGGGLEDGGGGECGWVVSVAMCGHLHWMVVKV